jgi:acyl transferase domain-containing protein
MNNGYYLANVLPRDDLLSVIGPFNAMAANEKDYVAMRISNRLDLKGPSVSVHTACSTSLVAVHMAAQSLRNFECDFALAGGASVIVPTMSGHVHVEGGMLSADGHCRPFDAAATGTLFSDGVGVVALRRLSDALRDGDRIHAVLIGSAINNDGAMKASFTAPSAEGQARAIAAALAAARVPADSIGFIETHGTATPIGDPIEVSALLRVYGRGKPGDRPRTALGSIKSNLGHTTAAAGVAGLIKAVLAVEHGKIPPTLHFLKANPSIDFGDRFFVADKLREWPDDNRPRRAAVSSMGVGGTNAHIIVEQPPTRTEPDRTRTKEVFLLTARSEPAMASLSRNLAEHVETLPDRALESVAQTLALGRRPLKLRRALVAGTTAELCAALRSAAASTTVLPGAVPPEVAFVFPGQGTQYPGMAAGLYESEPTFRAVLEECGRLLEGYIDVPLLELLYPAVTQQAQAAEQLQQTRYAQPAIFCVEYALAQLLISWGIRPGAMVGHSVGEFVAATLAGVFTLEESLHIVATRGRLMQAMPPGAMLSVRTSAGELAARLVPDTEIAAYNAAKMCVASGEHAAIQALEKRLQADDIPCKLLRTSHAFHSALMEPAAERFRDELEKIEPQAPSIPFVSTATGTWIREKEALDRDYWARHLRVPVRFQHAIEELCGAGFGLLVEAGPGGALLPLSRNPGKRESIRCP